MKPVADDKHQSMQRVRVGAIGLAVVVLLIGIASALFSGLREDRLATAGTNAAVVANMVIENAAAEANEPLADLGVAPSADEPSPANAQKR